MSCPRLVRSPLQASWWERKKPDAEGRMLCDSHLPASCRMGNATETQRRPVLAGGCEQEERGRPA